MGGFANVCNAVEFRGGVSVANGHFCGSCRAELIHFVKDVRSALNAPNLPFVIGVMGTGITQEKVDANAVSVAQRAAAASPELENITSVESYKLYDLSALKVFEKGWRDNFAEWCAVGSDRPYHYLGSGKFFVRFGDALADAMTNLRSSQ